MYSRYSSEQALFTPLSLRMLTVLQHQLLLYGSQPK